MIPYGRQDVTEEDIVAVEAVLRSDFLTQGPVVPNFEAAVAARVRAARGIAANSATSCLHIACTALGLGAGDWLWTVPTTFVASANCALYCGARVDFVDIDPVTLTMCPVHLAKKLEVAERAGCLPKVIVPVHLCGLPSDMRRIGALARRYGVRVIEDASHAVGAVSQGQPVGACSHSDVTVFSFHPVKIVTTGEGGMAMTQNESLADQMAMLRSHGITRDPGRMSDQTNGSWYYEQVMLGWNYRMTDMSAALGLSQLERLDDYIAQRHVIAERYEWLLDGLPLRRPHRVAGVRSAFHLFVVQLEDAARRREAFDALRNAGVGVNVHYIPVHLHPFYRERGFAPGDFPVAESYYASALSLPIHPRLTEAEQDHVAASLRHALVS